MSRTNAQEAPTSSSGKESTDNEHVHICASAEERAARERKDTAEMKSPFATPFVCDPACSEDANNSPSLEHLKGSTKVLA